MGALTAASARMSRAVAACRAADEEGVLAALHLLVLQVTEEHPTAVTVVFLWSDQGDYLTVNELLTTAGDSIDWDDPDSLASMLGGREEHLWAPFVDVDPDDPHEAHFHLPIRQTLDHFDRQENSPCRCAH